MLFSFNTAVDSASVPDDKKNAQDGSTKSVQVEECDLSKRSSYENSDDDSGRLSMAQPNLEATGDEFFNKGTSKLPLCGSLT